MTEVAPAALASFVSEAERVTKAAPSTPVATIPEPSLASDCTDPINPSHKNIPNGNVPTGAAVHGSAAQNAQSTSAHTTSFPATNVWATRSQKQRPPPVSAEHTNGSSLPSSGPPSASMSRSSSRKSKTQGVDVAQLGDATEWPDVRETLQSPAVRVEKDAGDKPASGSSSVKKGTVSRTSSPFRFKSSLSSIP